jgi:hypothetical protein
MRFLLSSLAVLAAFILIAVSGAMNYLFLSSLGKTPLEGQVYGAASLSFDMIKALLPVFIWWAWSDKKYQYIIPAFVAFLAFSALSFTSSLGFSAANKGHVTQIKEGAAARLKNVTEDIKDNKTKLKALAQHRPAAVVEQAIKSMRQNKRWTSTNKCAEGGATAAKSRAFCGNYFKLKAELETASSAAYIENRLLKLKTTEKNLRDSGAGGEVDPQASYLAKIFRLADSSTIKSSLVIFIAVLLELGSGLGLWLATGHSTIFKKKQRPADKNQPPLQAQTKEQIIEPRNPIKNPVAAMQEPLTLTYSHEPEQSLSEGDVEQIEHYLLDILRPDPNGKVRLDELYKNYTSWIKGKNLQPVSIDDFEQVIDMVMEAVGVAHDGDDYIGILIAKAA